MKRLFSLLLIAAIGSVAFTSCVRKNFDNPPDMSGNDPHLTVTHTIEQLKALNGPFNYHTGGDTTVINDDVIISGIVTADDRSGNVYKSIYIEDSTGALQIMIDAYSLYNDYPVGRKIYVKCKGLLLGYGGGAPVLGATTDETFSIGGLNGSDVANHIVKADVGHTVTPVHVTLAQLKSNPPQLFNRLIILDSVQFKDVTLTYTQPNGNSINRYVGDCGTDSIEVYTSNYANFAQQMVPTGRGNLTAIYAIYTSNTSGRITPELIIRDASDVQLTGPRCTGTSGGGTGGTGPIITIDSLRKSYPGGIYTVPNSTRISAVVISDIDNKNSSTGNYVLEDASQRGITMFISGSSAFKLGDSVVIDLTGATLKVYIPTNQTVGSLEIDGVTASKVTRVSTNKSVMPIPLTIVQINANIAKYESVLVKVINATASGGATYSGSRTLTDATGTMLLYTSTTALFAGQTVPTTPKTYVGIVTPYSTNELKLRNPAIDVY